MNTKSSFTLIRPSLFPPLFVIGNARRMRPQRCLCATLMPRRRWRHRRRSSGVNEYCAVNSSANSLVDLSGLSEATLASRSAVNSTRLLRVSGCGFFDSSRVASITERKLRTLGSFGRTGLRPSVGGTAGVEVCFGGCCVSSGPLTST